MRVDAKIRALRAMLAAIVAVGLAGSAHAKPLALHVASVSVATSTNGQPIVEVTVTPESAELLRDFSRQQLGRAVEVRVAGRVVMSPVVTREITNGHLQITGAFSYAEAQTILKHLTETGAVVEVEPGATSK
jgi:preprotein translocase subunit SecD